MTIPTHPGENPQAEDLPPAPAAAAPGPGFYDDPSDAKVQRYWDGQRWTDNRIPKATGAVDGKEQSASGTVVVGYALAVLMPLIGFIIGLTQINRSRHGIWIVVVSIVVFLLWVAVISSEGGGGGGAYSY